MKYTRLIKILFIVFVVKQLLWGFLTPWATGPDEIGHLSYIQEIFHTLNLPQYGHAAIYQNSYAEVPGTEINWIAQHPPLYYLLLTPIYFFAQLNSGLDPIYILRIFSILFGLLTLMAAAKIIREIRQKQPDIFDLTALSFIAFNPMFSHLSSVVNNDNLVISLSSWLTYFLIRYERSPEKKTALNIGTLLGLALLTKATILPFLIPLFFVFGKRVFKSLKLAIPELFRVITMPLLIAGWWYIGNYLKFGVLIPELKDLNPSLYLGDTQLMKSFPELINNQHPQYSLFKFFFQDNFIFEFFKNFWGTFGNLTNQLSLYQYFLFLLIIVLAIFGYLKRIKKNKKISKPEIVFLIIIFSYLISISIKVFQISAGRGFLGAAQGRYLFLAIIPLTYLLTEGITSFLGKRKYLLNILILLLLFNDFYSLFFTLIPKLI